MKLTEYLQKRLNDVEISEFEFQELVIRLINYSIIVRHESQTEQLLFDRLLRCRELVEEYLSIMGMQLYIDSRFDYARIYPPSSEIPGIKEADDNAWSGSLRQRLTQYEVALVLVVRAQYEKSLKEGKIDENGYALDSIESITIAAKNLLGRNLPEKLTERKKLFQRLKQLRLIEYRPDEAFESGEGWIKIHPMIITFVNQAAVNAIEPVKDSQLQHQATEQNHEQDNKQEIVSDRLDLAQGEEYVS